MNITVDSFDLLGIAICEVLRYYVPDGGDRYTGEPWRPAYLEWLLNVRHNADFTGLIRSGSALRPGSVTPRAVVECPCWPAGARRGIAGRNQAPCRCGGGGGSPLRCR